MENNSTIWQQLAYLEQKVNQNHQQLQELNQKLDQLIEHQNESPKAAVDTIEYNFEQLKIETLEGTLNIGLTPHQDLPFEQLDLPEESDEEVLTPMEQQIHNQLLPYIRKDLPKLFNQYVDDQEIDIDSKQKIVLIQEIQDQLPKRIKEHTSNLQQNGRMIIDRDQVPALINHIKKEINQGVQIYLEKLKENHNES
ncbi:spore germination protein GerPC [Aquisalibacillus elongatus]|uniref:Spore germination protein PC n=1 Tax=Aquisalibacillus elongatus TaxID=485577 RepID=A0A3N5B3T3_9BACI|nr:spore germination protein GerPC [Aquisalibacillus elongatus]RPF52064.1 spore germination protein PC [Aquisalibacillus elongatus]